MLEQIAMIIGYGVMGLAGIALAVLIIMILAAIFVLWWEWNVFMPRYKFDGKGNIVEN